MQRAFADVESSLTNKRWKPVAEEIHRQGLAISQSLEIPEIVSRVIATQNVPIENVRSFMDPKIKTLMPDPKSFKDLEKAAKRIIDAINGNPSYLYFSQGISLLSASN